MSELEKKLEPELSAYLKNRRSLKLWLPLSKKLALLISNGDDEALRFRDKLLEDLRR